MKIPEKAFSFIYSPLIIPCLFVIASVIVNSAIGFHQMHNDFWDLYFVSRHISFSDLNSLYNPCFPFGYCLLLKMLLFPINPVTGAILLNIFFGALILYASAVLYARIFPLHINIALLLLFASVPKFFFYMNAGGSDPGAAVFFTLGALLVCMQFLATGKISYAKFLIAGIFMGFGALFRYHVLVADCMFVLAAFVVFPRRWKYILSTAIGICCAYSPQILINLVTHHGLLETRLGSTNVFNLMYGINWYTTSIQEIPRNALTVILSNPFLFAKRYVIAILQFSPMYLPPIIASFVIRNFLWKKISIFIAIWTVLYFAFFSATASDRQILLPLGLTFLTVGFLFMEIESISKKVMPWLQSCFWIKTALLSAIPFALFFINDGYLVNRAINERKTCNAAEQFVQSMQCTDVRQVFTTDFDLYFDDMPFFLPYYNGGWSRWGTYGYNKEYPEFPVSTLDAFTQNCSERGVRFVILTDRCRDLSMELWKVYSFSSVRPDLLFLKQIGRFRIFRVI
jgi:hypothetical protein